MLIAAERTLIRGRAEAGLGVAVDRNGVIERVAPLTELGPPTHLWPGEMLMPGMVNVFAPELSTIACAVLARQIGSHELTGALQRYRAAGTTTVGVPHGAARSCAHGRLAPFAEADLLVAAAQAVDIRVAFLDRIAVDTISLDEALTTFEQLVRHLMGYRDARLSWALWATLGPALPMDALTGLRVRLGHLPCFIELSPSLSPAATATTVRTLVRLQVLDACTSLISHTILPREALEALLPTGASVAYRACDLPAALTLPLAGAQGTYILMTGRKAPAPHLLEQAQAPLLTWPTAHALIRATSVIGTRALGLQGGGLVRGAWADACTVALSPLMPPPQRHFAPPSTEEWLATTAASLGAQLPVQRCMIGGVVTLPQH